jgi:hypothetical protein
MALLNCSKSNSESHITDTKYHRHTAHESWAELTNIYEDVG